MLRYLQAIALLLTVGFSYAAEPQASPIKCLIITGDHGHKW